MLEMFCFWFLIVLYFLGIEDSLFGFSDREEFFVLYIDGLYVVWGIIFLLIRVLL